MCELLGMSFSRPISPLVSFPAFRERSDKNPDGWGIACYPEACRAAMVVKEPTPAKHSRLAAFVAAGGLPRSSVHVVHIRKAGSAGAKNAYRNTHPFFRTVGNRDYVFAHNGTLHKMDPEPASEFFKPIGETDSEQAFCQLLANHEPMLRSCDWQAIRAWLIDANEAGPLNCLLSDGEALLAYRDKNGARELHMVERRAPFPTVKLADDEVEIDLGEIKSRDDYGWIFATRPLTSGEAWKQLDAGELVVVCAGGIQSRLTG